MESKSKSQGAERLPPHNLDAERGVLGAMMLDAECVNVVMDELERGDFYLGKHAIIFAAIVEMHERGMPADPLLLERELAGKSQLEQAGGADYLRDLLGTVPSSANAEYYAQIVHECATKRHLGHVCAGLAERIYDPGETGLDLLTDADRAIREAMDKHRVSDFRATKDLMVKALESLEKLHGVKGGLLGAATEYYDVDRITGGLREGEMIVLGGRPSTGKTTLGLNIGLRAALRGDPVAIFSLEMTTEQLCRNLLSMHTKVRFQREDGTTYIGDDDWTKLMDGAGQLADAPIYIDESDNLPIHLLRARARRLKQDAGIKLIIIDYLQQLRAQYQHESRQQEISDISRGIKGMAKELHIPVLAISQLNRDLEKGGKPRHPSMADLRESGAIEQDADVIILLSREEPDAPDTDALLKMKVNVAKNRNGRTDSRLTLLFQRDILRFESCVFGSAAT